MKLGLAVALLVTTGMLASAAMQPAPGGWPDQHSAAYLGVHIDQVTPQVASSLKLADTSGALITYVDQDGPAGKAGLKGNDVVVGFNGSKIQDPGQLQDLIHGTAAGKVVNLTVVREGQKKDISVTLGAWPTAVARVRPPLPPSSYMAFAPPTINVPDIDVPSFTTLASRHGAVVENMCPQLADYFGVPHGQGVMVRSVEKGSPAEAAGLKAGDVIVKVNNETVHDMADWRRAMRAHSGKIPMSVVRDKHEQSLVMNLPSSGDTSKLQNKDRPDFEDQMQAWQQEMEKLGPEIQRQTETLATIRPNQQELDQMRADIERSMKLKQKDLEKMQKEIQKSLPSQAELQQQIEKSMKLKQKDIEEMQRNFAQFKPSPQELEQMRREIEESMKTWAPQFQQQMEQVKKQMEEHKLDLQQMLKGLDSEHEF
jgi:hypothetical protein